MKAFDSVSEIMYNYSDFLNSMGLVDGVTNIELIITHVTSTPINRNKEETVTQNTEIKVSVNDIKNYEEYQQLISSLTDVMSFKFEKNICSNYCMLSREEPSIKLDITIWYSEYDDDKKITLLSGIAGCDVQINENYYKYGTVSCRT